MSLLAQNFVMFERVQTHFNMDKDGLCNDDLKFKDIVSSESKWYKCMYIDRMVVTNRYF
jgi:hypothetical protein